MKILRHNDMDGKLAGYFVLISHKGQCKKEDFIELDYIKPIPYELISKDELVIIVDYSFKVDQKDQLDRLLEITNNVIWLDHHITSKRLLDAYPEYNNLMKKIVIDMNRCGAMIAYDEFIGGEHPMVLKLVDDYDRFVLSTKHSEYLKLFLDSVKNDQHSEIWKSLHTATEKGLNYYINKGKTIKEYVDAVSENDVNSFSYEITLFGHRCLVINKPMFSSKAFGSKFEEYPIVCVWNFREGVYKYSLYSYKEQVDCSVIAEHFGGGGHKGAAGFTTNYLLNNEGL